MQNEERNGLEVLTLDFDFSRQGSIDRQEIPEFMETAHEQIEILFLDLISADYKEIMQGGAQ